MFVVLVVGFERAGLGGKALFLAGTSAAIACTFLRDPSPAPAGETKAGD